MSTSAKFFVLFIIFIKTFHCKISRGATIIDLNTILDDFSESCYISIQNLERNIEFQIMDYPISYSFISKTSNFAFPIDYYFSKYIFCRVDLIVVTNYDLFTAGVIRNITEEILRSQTMQYCSLIHSHLSEYSWTNCVILILGVGKQIKRQFFTNIPSEFKSKKLWNSEFQFGLAQAQFYVMFLPDPISIKNQQFIYGAKKSNEIFYICRLCADSHDTFHQVSIHANESSRKFMEKIARTVTGNGKNILLPITSYLEPPIENQEEPTENFAFGTMAGFDSCNNNIISGSNYAIGLNEITMNNYYFHFRCRLNYIELLQKILFENVPQNVTTETIRNSVKATIYSFPQYKSVTVDKFMLLPYGKKLYLVRKDFFNFITCHGLRKSESFTVYLKPFNLQIWYGMSLILVLSTFILVIRMKQITLWPIFHHVSMLLENTTGHIHKLKFAKLGLTGKLLFFCFAFMLMLTGNLYKGIITRDIILPITSTIPYSKIDELKDFELIVLPRNFETEQNTSITYKIIAGLNENRNGSTNLKNMYSSFGEEIATLFLFPDVDPEACEYYSNIYERMSIVPTINYAYELLAKNCNAKKQVFVGLRNELDSFIDYKDSRSHFVYGKDEYIPVNYYWQIPNAVGGYLHERMSMIITSGIEKVWKQLYFKKSKSYQVNHKNLKCKDCSFLDTNLGTLFKLCLFGTSIGLVVFLTEIICFKLHKLISKA